MPSIEEIQEIRKKGLETLLTKCSRSCKKNKYYNTKTVIDGITFASKAEAKRYTELKLLLLSGEIKAFELQPRFELQPKFEKDNIKYRAISYIADFRVINKDNSVVIEDVKSRATATEAYKIKKKLFEYKYPYLTLREVYS